MLIVDDLDECFVLSFHTQISAAGGYEKTDIGKLVLSAKSYGKATPGNKATTKELAGIMSEFVESHPTYRDADVLISVQGSNPAKSFDLPGLINQEMCRILGVSNGNSAIRKVRTTKPMKDCTTVAEKINNIKDTYTVERKFVKDKTALLIDDIYHTGLSMNELGRMIVNAGGASILGLTASKTLRDLPDFRLSTA